MTILQAILLGLFISYSIGTLFLGNNIFIKLFWKVLKYAKEKIYLNKLERINYFEYNDNTEKKEFIKIITDSLKYHLLEKESIQTLINYFTFKFDNRNYLIEFEDERFIIDKIGHLDKWHGLEIRSNSELNDFLTFTTKLGLNIKISKIKYLDEEENKFKIDLEVNKTNYTLHQNYENDYFHYELIYEFIKLLNEELRKIKSKEKIYFINDYPNMIIFLNHKIYNYLLKLKPIGQRPLKPEDWKLQNV